jgi:hypothetical protein
MKHNCEAKLECLCNGRLFQDGCEYWIANDRDLCRYNFSGKCIRPEARKEALEKFIASIKGDSDNGK